MVNKRRLPRRPFTPREAASFILFPAASCGRLSRRGQSNQNSPENTDSEIVGPAMNVFFFRRAALICLGGVWFCLATSAANLTALDRYVAQPDTNYNYTLVNRVPGNGQSTF